MSTTSAAATSLPEGYGGVLEDADGVDVRNNHVLEGDASEGSVDLSVEVSGAAVSIRRRCDPHPALGVLKAGAVNFEPPLPQRKQQAIDRLGFGTLNKVLLI